MEKENFDAKRSRFQSNFSNRSKKSVENNIYFTPLTLALKPNFHKQVLELENQLLKEQSIETVNKLFVLYKEGTEYYEMKKNNLLHKEFLFKLQKIIISDELTQMLNFEKKSRETIKPNMEILNSNITQLLNPNNNNKVVKEFDTEPGSTSEGTIENNQFQFANEINKNDNTKNSFKSSRTKMTSKTAMTNDTLNLLPSYSKKLKIIKEENSLNSKSNTKNLSKRISQINKNINYNFSSIETISKLIEHCFNQIEEKLNRGCEIIKHDTDQQALSLKKRIREKKKINRNRQISDQFLKKCYFSVKHVNKHKRNFSSISKKKYNEDTVLSEDNKYNKQDNDHLKKKSAINLHLQFDLDCQKPNESYSNLRTTFSHKKSLSKNFLYSRSQFELKNKIKRKKKPSFQINNILENILTKLKRQMKE